MSCGCGRSPTGNCIGWHKLSEDEYRQKLAIYENKQLEKALEDIEILKDKVRQNGKSY